MDRVEIGLSEMVRKAVSSYATYGYNLAGQRAKLLFVENPQEQVFAVLDPYDPVGKKAELVVMARIVNDQVIIEHDQTGNPLYDELKQAGVPDNQIVVAWASK